MSATIKRMNELETVQLTTPSESRFVAIPYQPETFDRIRKILADYDIRVVGRASESLTSFFTKLKDKVPKKYISGVCYELVCDCNKVYIGQTSQYLSNRFHQHNTRDVEHSAMSAHLQEDNCSISFENMNVICSERNQRVREIKEAFIIRTTDNINGQENNFEFGHQYDSLII